jgi:proline-rich protein PRCC
MGLAQPKQNKFRPSMVHKAKHQITYLAYQAQQMQDELRERSAQSRRTKRETYSKYGF